MGTTADKLTYLNETKEAIKNAVNAKGGDITPATPFREYAEQINGLAGGGEKKVFNVSIDQIFGSVDENGVYVPPVEAIEVDLMGVKKGLPNRMFAHWGANYAKHPVKKIYAPDLEEVPSEFCVYAARGDNNELYFPKVVRVRSGGFSYYSSGVSLSEMRANFDSLEVLGIGEYGNSAFLQCFMGAERVELVQRMFPKLRLVYGTAMFGNFLKSSAYLPNYKIQNVMFPSVEEFYGAYGTSDITSQYSSVFNEMCGKIFLPKCIKVPTCMFRPQADSQNYVYIKELHFAIKNRAAIEACNGFDNNFGGTGVFFDLVSAITVNDVVYQRSEENSITETFEKFYTAWKSDGGDIVYTYDGNYTVEPAVGTDVFSDGGQTVVGTVSAIE